MADAYVEAVCDLDPLVATSVGTRLGDDRLPDLGPAGLAAEEALDRPTLTELDRQAIGYKLGERAWLAGRAAAQRARGVDLDLEAWHMAALFQGSLGLEDPADELAQL